MDIQFVRFNDALPVTSVDEVPGSSPRSVRISGPDFSTTLEVEINGELSPSFILPQNSTDHNKTLLWAQVPNSQRDQPIRSVVVVSAEFRLVRESIVTFALGREPKKVSGLLQLMQSYVKILLSTPYHDAFLKTVGGGVLDVVGANAESEVGSNLTSSVTRAVSAASSQLQAMQSRQVGLTDDERLLAANLLSCQYNVDITGLDVRVELIAKSGKTAIASLGM
jgi:hypothetical protein